MLWKYFAWVTDLVFQVPRSYSVPVNCGLSLFGFSYLAVLSADALRQRNNVQIYSICVCNILLFIFTVMRYEQTAGIIEGLATARALGDTPLVDLSMDLWAIVGPILLSSSAISGVCTLALLFFGFKLHYEFAWAIYRHVNGSTQTRRRLLVYKVCTLAFRCMSGASGFSPIT